MASTPTGDRGGPREQRQPFDGVVLDAEGRNIGIGSLVRGSGGEVDWLELPRFLTDVVGLVWRVVRDPRVPTWQKVAVGAAVAYVASPLDVLPDVIPGIGRLDDLLVLRRALGMLVKGAGPEVLTDHWQGSDEGLALVLRVAGVTS